MSRYYRDKVIVISGGGSGIGRAIAGLVASDAKAIVIADKNKRSGEGVVRGSAGRSANIEFVHTDMTDLKSVESLLDHSISRYGRVDILFNCAGIVQGGEVDDTPLSHALDVIDTNLHATIVGTHVFYRKFIEQGSDQLVHFGSAAGLLPTPMMSFYTASKYGIVGFSHALRAEAMPKGVKVNVVCPGFVRTPIYETAYYDNLEKDKVLHLLFHKLPIQSPDVTARRIITKVARNRMTIHTWNSLYFAWLLYRISPPFYVFIASRFTKVARKQLTKRQP